MTLSIYLNFDGTCAEVFEFYGDVFESKPTMMMTFADGPPDFQTDPEDAGKILHMSLPIGSSILMGSDVAEGYGPAPTSANCFHISFAAASREDADEKFAKLQEGGGTATWPMQDTFWGSYFGMVTDRFGTSWMIAFDAPSDTA